MGRTSQSVIPKQVHKRIQRQLLDLLQSRAGHRGRVDLETPFRAVPEYDLRSADVSYISDQRYRAIDEDDNLRRSPDLMIEVFSPSNTRAEKAALCLATGAYEFWMVDPGAQSVTVLIKGARGKAVYRRNELNPLPLFDSDLPVNDIFDEPVGR